MKVTQTYKTHTCTGEYKNAILTDNEMGKKLKPPNHCFNSFDVS